MFIAYYMPTVVLVAKDVKMKWAVPTESVYQAGPTDKQEITEHLSLLHVCFFSPSLFSSLSFSLFLSVFFSSPLSFLLPTSKNLLSSSQMSNTFLFSGRYTESQMDGLHSMGFKQITVYHQMVRSAHKF